MKIPKKYSQIVFVLLMALGMSFFMSFALTAINVGINNEFPARWGRAFLLAYPIAVIAALIIVPVVRKLVDKVTE